MLHEKAIARTAKGAREPTDFSGEWQNELGSKVHFVQVGNALAGRYESVKSMDGSPATGVLQGFVNGDLISFIVQWDEFQAITAWVGQLNPEAKTQTIDTLWQMTQQVDEGDEWASINAGADSFKRTK